MAPAWEPSVLLFPLLLILGFRFCSGHDSGSCSSPIHAPPPPLDHHHHHHHGCSDDHHHQHHHDHDHDHHHQHYAVESQSKLLPEELAEEEDLKLYGFGSEHDDDFHIHGGTSELSNLSLWVYAMGCSLLVSMASLICLSILPLICVHGKPSKTIVDSLAAFGAGAMLGDAFLHQLPHAFGGNHSHSHGDHVEHTHDHLHHGQSHSHSFKDLSVGLSVLSGIILFLLVEKAVRYIDEFSGKGANAHGHGHHHHGRKKRNDSEDAYDDINSESFSMKNDNKSDISAEGKVLNGVSDSRFTGENDAKTEPLLRQRLTNNGATDGDKPEIDAASGSSIRLRESEPDPSSSNLVLGYLNLFSDGVHNFTDGIALGSAFLLHGSVGGWSRTLFLLAHELPQEVGDFGILVRSGFSVSKALFFNFLSALVALAGTALALLLGKDPGQSDLIEGFTAGGFIYIAVAGVLPEMNNGSSSFRSTVAQLTWLILGMGVALCISLAE